MLFTMLLLISWLNGQVVAQYLRYAVEHQLAKAKRTKSNQIATWRCNTNRFNNLEAAKLIRCVYKGENNNTKIFAKPPNVC